MFDDKPWLTGFLDLLSGSPPIEQTLALALAAQADTDGFIESIDYDDLVERSAISRDMARKLLRHSTLSASGIITHIPRALNNRPLSPSVRLKV